MFLLRCVFWLSAVYAAMFFGLPWQAGRHEAAVASTLQSGPARLDAGQLGRTIASRAVAGVAGLCAARASDCVRDAAGLTALGRTAIAGEPDYASAHASAPLVAIEAATPRPSPDPRRPGRSGRHL